MFPKLFWFCLLVAVFKVFSAPLPDDTKEPATQDAKSAFGVAFDEIVVESSLRVVPRKNNARQAKNSPVNLSDIASELKTAPA